MKSNITLNLQPSAARTARTFFISQFEDLIKQKREIEEQIESLVNTIRAIDSQLRTGPNGEPQNGKSRRPYGSAAKAIGDLFKSLPAATALSMKDVSLKAGTSWSSTFRILRNSPQYERVKGKKWRLKPSTSN